MITRALSCFRSVTTSTSALFTRSLCTASSDGFSHGQLHKAFTSPGVTAENNKTSLLFSVKDEPGALEDVLKLFWKYNINMSRIESRPSKLHPRSYDFFVDFDGAPNEDNVVSLLNELRTKHVHVKNLDPVQVPWFPTKISEIDSFSTKTLDAGAELDSDHPGFKDEEYRHRRRMIVENAQSFKHGESIPRVQYTQEEIDTWGIVYRKLRDYTRKFGAREFNHVLPLLERNCGYGETNIPQLQDISDYLKECTGFSLRPVGGLLSARDFLNALAFRVFFSTQYIRHHSTPLYTPEPDIVHELLGHVPMFADPDFADFSHEIGLASLGASDDEIKRLATCYWFSVEFGLCKEQGDLKAYGAGLLSSFGEIEYACAPYRPAGGEDKFPEYRPWDPKEAARTAYPITCYQPVYFVADSLTDAKDKMRQYCEQEMKRPFHVKYDALTQTVQVDRAVARGQYTITLQT